jgi:transposase
MAYIVEQKVKGKIYLYKVESYWDKNKQQARQKRTYLGPKEKGKNAKIKQKKTDLVSKNFGNMYLLRYISNKLKITELLQSIFTEAYFEILTLAYYEIMEGSALYLFPYWFDEQYLPKARKLYSSAISKLCDDIGRAQTQRIEFINQWIEHLKPIKGIYFDITSISSYSTKIDFIEWGYNRDNENLPQLNMGVVLCQNNLLPIYYSLYPGSIVDVTTLKNIIKYLKVFKIENILCVFDKGFFSKSNILELNNHDNKIEFIQPVPLRLTKAKALLKNNKIQLRNNKKAFKYNEEILHHLSSNLEFDNIVFESHIFFNEKIEIDQKHNFLKTLIEIEEKAKKNKFSCFNECLKYKNENIKEKFISFFKCNRATQEIEINLKVINSYIAKMGCFILLTNRQNMDKIEVLEYYRNKDNVEKIFDIVKNEMDGDRLRVHSQYNTEGRLFIKFIALIIYMEISKVMKDKELFEKYTVKEMFSELKKLKIIQIGNNEPFLSELSKRQRIILKAFDIKDDISIFHRY